MVKRNGENVLKTGNRGISVMKRYGASVGFFIFMLVIWEAVVRLFGIAEFILPSPLRIGEALSETSALLWEHSLQTIIEVLWGFSLAILAGVVLAMLMGLFPIIKKVLYPLLVLSQTIPIMAVAPLLIIWFGYNLLPKVMVAALVCFFPITVSLVEGLEAVDKDIMKLLLAMGASPWQIFKTVQLPGALPSFFAGLKISATYSVMGAVIGEWLGASKGLGVFMTRSMHSFLTAQVFASIVVISLLSLIFFGLISVLARIIMPWHEQK
jgi:ABC-type nitrate/sulfonate/bicarbonate transport system permease component